MAPLAELRVVGVLALALLAGPSIVDCLAQPTLELVPSLGKQMEGGTIMVHVIYDIADGQADSAPCLFLRAEPSQMNEEAEPNRITRQQVCPGDQRSGPVILMARKATGHLVLELNGTNVSRPYIVPEDAIAETYASWSGVHLEAPTGTLRDHGRDEGMWRALLQAIAYIGILVVLALRWRWFVAVGLLVLVTFLLLAALVNVEPHVAGGIVLATWLAVAVDGAWRLTLRRRGRAPPDEPGPGRSLPPQV